jgi:hypothetical protein
MIVHRSYLPLSRRAAKFFAHSGDFAQREIKSARRRVDAGDERCGVCVATGVRRPARI